MKIPETSIELPYIEFRFDRKGRLTLSATNDWWGGKNHSFMSSDGYEGNTCLPKDLDSYIKAFKTRKIKAIEREILALEKRRDVIIGWQQQKTF